MGWSLCDIGLSLSWDLSLPFKWYVVLKKARGEQETKGVSGCVVDER